MESFFKLGFLLLIVLSFGFCNLESNYVTIPSGTYPIGVEGSLKNPSRMEDVRSFEISKYETTNSQFLAFIEATGYVTTAEQFKNAKTFRVGLDEFEWEEDTTANWHFPFGTNRNGIENKMDHPVTCISFFDIQEYCKWANVRLPTLVEWEVASKGNVNSKYFFEEPEKVTSYGNIWINKLHKETPINDEFLFTAPVGSFQANPFGIFDMYGNVFEFCSDKYPLLDGYSDVVCARGGSWWCSEYACSYFNSVEIGKNNKFASFSNQGFRTVRKLDKD